MTRYSLAALAGGLLLTATPVLAQDGMPRRDSGPYEERRDSGSYEARRDSGPNEDSRLGGGLPAGPRGFAGMSDAGRTVMRDAMRGAGDRRADRAAVRAARERMLDLLGADRLDTAAIKRAMDEEREIANDSRARAQAALLTGFARLSVADRRAFVADARAMKGRMEARFKQFRRQRGPGGEPPQ